MTPRIIENFEHVVERPDMYLLPVNSDTAESFINGFTIGCKACGLEVPLEIQQSVTEDRGWEFLGVARPTREMRERGFSEPQIATELLTIELEGWRRFHDKNRPSA
jgi:hypothetical protein